jgi:GT2 family glycosyltransferase
MYCPTALVYHVGSGTSGSKYNSFKVRLSARNSVYLNYKNMPILQLILNILPLCMGYVVKYFFFVKKGWGKDYKEGVSEGLRTMKAQKKVSFQMRHLMNYIHIEIDLIVHTFSYIKDWCSRKLFKK